MRGFAGVLPVHPEAVVFFPLVWIAEHFVGLVDFLEFLFGRFFVLRHIRVVLACQFAERLLNVFGAGITRHSESGVVVFEFD